MKPTVVVTCKQMQVELPKHRTRIESAGYTLVVPDLEHRQQFSSAELKNFTHDAVGVIAGDDELDRPFFEASPQLRVLIRWGVGMDSVDHVAARDHGVTVRNTPGVFGGEVADSAWAYILLLARGHHIVDAAVRRGEWPKREGISLDRSSLGVIGMGAIGRMVAQRGLGFGMKVAGHDPFLDPSDFPDGVSSSDLNLLLESSRFVVVTCPSTPETFHLMGSDAFRRMRKDAFMVNVARGPIVDEIELAHALVAGEIAGAGLDVFETEPLPSDSALRSLPNVILGAHNGSNTREGVERASRKAVDFLLEELVN